MTTMLLTPIPEHLAQRMELLLYGAVLCLAAGLLLLFAAVFVLRRRSRRARKSRTADYRA